MNNHYKYSYDYYYKNVHNQQDIKTISKPTGLLQLKDIFVYKPYFPTYYLKYDFFNHTYIKCSFWNNEGDFIFGTQSFRINDINDNFVFE